MKKHLFILSLQLTLFVSLILTFISSSAQWTRKADALKNRSEIAGGVVYNSKLYAFLGFRNAELQPEPSSEVYDPATDTWTLLASIPDNVSMTHQGVVLIDNTVWHIGGRVGQNPGPLTSDIWIYNITANSWSRGPQLINPATGEPLRWAAGGAVLLGRTIHIFGGFAIDACNHDQDKYHLTLDVDTWLADPSKPAQWKNDLAPLPIKRNHLSSTVLGGKIYAIGGQFGHDCNGGTEQPFSHVYDPSTDTWTQLPDLPTPRSHSEGAIFAMDGKIFLIGGQGTDGASTNQVTIFEPEGKHGAGKWKNDHSLTLPEHYEGLLARVIGDQFIITDGGIWYSGNPRKETYSQTIGRNPVYEFGFPEGCLHLKADAGGIAKGKTLLFTIDGSKDYTISSNANWLTATKNAAGLATQNGADIELTADTKGLAPGNYSATITAIGSGSGPDYTEASYCVTLTVDGITATLQTLEAETAVLNGTKVASDHPEYTGTGFVDYRNPEDDYIEWSINKPQAGSTPLWFRYSNGKEFDRPLKLEVNGVTVFSTLSFPSTGDWTNWSVSNATVYLNKGINTIRLTAIGFSGPNIDHLTFRTNAAVETAQRAGSENTVMPISSDLLKAHVYPNPASGNARLAFKTSSDLPVEMEIIDMLGKTHKTMKFLKGNSNSFDFSVKGLATGIYIIKIKQGNSLRSTKLIVGKETLH